jgi:hypothetical protein
VLTPTAPFSLRVLMSSAGTTEGVGATAGVVCAAPAGGDRIGRHNSGSLSDSFAKRRGEHRSWRGYGLRVIRRRKQSRAAVRRVPSLSKETRQAGGDDQTFGVLLSVCIAKYISSQALSRELQL